MDALDLTAIGSGYYRVFVDGVQASQHTTEREAVERAAERKLATPLASVTYDHDYVVRVDSPAPVLPAWGAERRSGYERRQRDVAMNRPGQRQGQRRGSVRQYPTTPVVGYVTITTPPVSALEVGETHQAGVLVSTPPLPVPSDPTLPYQQVELTGRSVTWATTNAAVATVTSGGLIEGIGAGTCDISVTCEGVSDSIGITVTAVQATVSTVEVSPASFSVFEAGTQQLTATPKDAGGDVILGLTATWSSNNTNVATVNASTGLVTGVAAGTCTITATVDAVPGTSACTVAVAPSGSEFVTFADADVEFILGPLLVDGSVENPWAQFDTKGKATGTSYGTNAPEFYPRSSLTGTVSITNGATALTGSGTTFLTQVGTHNRLYIHDGTAYRGPFFASSVNSDTSITLSTAWPHPTTSGGAWHSNGSQSGLTNSQYHDSFTHYYDLAQSMYILYHRTGDTAYRTLARKAADAWYSGRPNEGVGSGDYGIAPREGFMAGLMLRALDGRPEMWDFIERWVDYQFNSWLWVRRNNSKLYYGVRDGAFCFLYASLLAQVLPDSYRNTADTANVDGVAKRAYHLSRVVDIVTLYYERLQDADGGFYSDADYAPDFGVVVFHMGYLLEALIVQHKLIRDNPSYTSQAATTAAIITSMCDCIWTRGFRPEVATGSPTYNWRGLWYEIFRSDAGRNPTGSATTGGDLNKINEARQLAVMVIHAFGYAYHLSSDIKYLTQGDEMFSACYGYGSGPAADARGCLLDSFDTATYLPPNERVRGKEFNQAMRSAGRYLARRIGSTD